MKYSILWKKSAVKDLSKLEKLDQKMIFSAISSLEMKPRPFGCTKLTGLSNFYRIRIGDYRVIYQVKDNIITVEIIKIGHRKDIYSKL